MKRLIIIKLILTILITTGVVIPSLAQSDYEIVQKFKQRYEQIEKEIQSADSLTELNSLIVKIDRLRNDNIEHKALLDKSLYPDNFDTSLEKLKTHLVIRNQDFTTIDVLQIENMQLKEQVDALNKRNTELINQIQQYEFTSKRNSKRVAELEKLVAQLKFSMKRRDELITGIVDSLMPQLNKGSQQLSSEDKNNVYTQVEKNNVLSNVKRSLQDNIRFIRVTTLEPEDLNEIKNQQDKFSKFWKDLGLKLTDIYAENNKKAKEIKDIDSLFSLWNEAVTNEAWTNIKAEFAYNGIQLVDFNNGEKFTTVITSFIDDEIKNIGVKSPEESEKAYSMFSDSTWFRVINPKWIPYLLENKMLTQEQKKSIDAKIADWTARLTPASFDWAYILVALLAIVGVGFMYRKRTSTSKKTPGNPPDKS